VHSESKINLKHFWASGQGRYTERGCSSLFRQRAVWASPCQAASRATPMGNSGVWRSI